MLGERVMQRQRPCHVKSTVYAQSHSRIKVRTQAGGQPGSDTCVLYSKDTPTRRISRHGCKLRISIETHYTCVSIHIIRVVCV
jgi:hypothetical protein